MPPFAAPLQKKENLTSECSTAFNQLKDAFHCRFSCTQNLVPVHPRELHRPRSRLIAVTGGWRKKYGITVLKTLGLVWAVRYFHPYLISHKTIVYTDHSACLSLSLVWAVHYFHPYLIGHKTIVYTNHSACLSWLNHLSPSGQLALTMQEMDLIKHRFQHNADALTPYSINMSYCASCAAFALEWMSFIIRAYHLGLVPSRAPSRV